ncbi:MAG: hypothetical protein M1825_003917 [Sarcosagium campestre]|nr:MAG: hypothetical protein M1825_003917 [Sarcosagium campestre]
MPWHLFNFVWLGLNRLLSPVIRRLFGRARGIVQLDLLIPDWVWHLGYQPFETVGTDTFLAVSGGGSILVTCSADVINQITSRRVDFPKPCHLYGALNIYGSNVVTTEGAAWRQHRRITAPPFAEKNNEIVWAESLDQTAAMVKSWFHDGDDKQGYALDIAEDAAKMTLHVISKAGFGVKLTWTGAEDVSSPKFNSVKVPAGHALSYRDALGTLLRSLFSVMLLPHSLLRRSPSKAHNSAVLAYDEWHKYMNEMIDDKKRILDESVGGKDADLMSALLNSAEEPQEAKGNDGAESGSNGTLSHEEILGNMFIFILAGHETTANTVHFALLFLACNPSSQRRLQTELDSIFGDRPPTQWSYDEYMPRLSGGMAGAVMNETLRLIPPVINIPKYTGDRAQTLIVDGRKVVVPARTAITLDVVAAARNPNNWGAAAARPSPPSSPSTPTPSTASSGQQQRKHDLNDFRPERWISTTKESQSDSLPTSVTTRPTPTLFHPPRGAFIPFSEGPRSCLGRRFAQVEVLVVLARILKFHSVELDVREWSGGADLAQLTPTARGQLWNTARARADHLMTEGMGSIISLQIRGGGKVPLSVVSRGSEIF